MICLCVEASHQKGMGHLFRALTLASALADLGLPFIFAINDDPKSLELLAARDLPFRTVGLNAPSGWERELIDAEGVRVWVNDRLETELRHADAVRDAGCALVSFDDPGSGAARADLQVAALPSVFLAHELKGTRVLKGIEYLVLNPEIVRYRRLRHSVGSIVITLGGSDTYGTTVAVARLMKECGAPLTFVLGPNFRHRQELDKVIGHNFDIKETVPSLIAELARHDLAITGGGITPFEACASGLPCIIVGNELHEIENARYLEQLGCAVFAGHHEKLQPERFSLDIDLESLSGRCLARVPTSGARNIAREIEELWQRPS